MGSGDIGKSFPETSTISDQERGHISLNSNESKHVQVIVEEETPIGVVGSGNFGIAITTKLKKCGIPVVVGSRSPSLSQVSIERALQESIVILAIPTFCWKDLPVAMIKPGTVIICLLRSPYNNPLCVYLLFYGGATTDTYCPNSVV